MALTVSPQIKIVAVVGLLAAVAFAGAMMFLSPGSTSSAPPKRIVPLGKRHHTRTVPAPAVHTARTRHVRRSSAVKTPSRTAAPKAQHPAPKLAPPANPYHLPVPLVRALAAHDTVVVALYSPESKVDTIAYAEARAGAALARGDVAFLGLSVLDPAQVRNLTEQLGLLSDPGLLIYRRPGTLAVRIDGFADRETVAQAADNARIAS